MLSLENPLDLCCDNCIRKNHHFESIYDLIGFLDTSYGREPISRPVEDDDDDGDDNDLGPAVSSKLWGNLRSGNHLTIRRRVLENWRYECWKRDYRLCSWGVVGVMSDLVLSNLASSTKIKTINDLLEAAADWDYVGKYGHEVLSILEGADHEHQLESQAQRAKTRQLNRKRKIEDLERDSKQQDGFPHPMLPDSIPLLSAHTRIIEPIVVKHVERPAGPCPPRPQPRPTLVSHRYPHTDAFDSLMNNPRSMWRYIA